MKTKSVFVCNECGTESIKWMGKCPGCSAWNTMVEEVIQSAASTSRGISAGNAGANFSSSPKKLSEIDATEEERIMTGMGELDRVLGGGIVRGSLVLVGGDPGIGKSTILLQISEYLGKNKSVLYVSGEESQKQIKMRAERLSITTENLKLLSETNMDAIVQTVDRESPDILIVDSVQTMFNPNVSSLPGNVTQIREVTVTLMKIAKERGISVFLVGHVTKEGALAGPKVLEHIVDCVLYFEGEKQLAYRIIRAVKNRFGSTNEIGMFEMSERGLIEVKNPSEMLLSGRPANVSGSCVICTMEGTRPIMAEIQALLAPTNFGNPRRMSTGLDNNRAVLLMAVLERRVGLQLSSFDAYINVVGGLRITEPAIDLGVMLAIASGFRNIPIPGNVVAVGEVGLTGELRACSFLEGRIAEAEKLGFEKIILPASSAKKLKPSKKIEVVPVWNVREAIEKVL
ncbi:MAG: DNA repair protein RadA [Oscillospiraceae bacterium]|nr:DNA repair protein RadA [Oscillospiraceae bacterium]